MIVAWCLSVVVVRPLDNAAVTDSRIGMSEGEDIWGPLTINKLMNFRNT